MNKIDMTTQLAEAERFVSECARILNRQRQMVADLERDDRDAGLARELLKKFGAAQAMHVAHRDKLKEQLQFGS